LDACAEGNEMILIMLGIAMIALGSMGLFRIYQITTGPNRDSLELLDQTAPVLLLFVSIGMVLIMVEVL